MLTESLQIISFKNLIDMGCGTGQLLIELAHLKPDAHFIGIDSDEQKLNEARHRVQEARIASRVSLLAKDCTQTSLPAHSADVAVFRNVLHHVKDLSIVFREVNRILCPGSFFFIQDGTRMPEIQFEEMNEELRPLGIPLDIHPGFDTDTLTKQLSEHGFNVEQVTIVGKATFATPPYTTKEYVTDAFLLSATKSEDLS
jgi:ubiquinone/menaquinone biosynthesis C-methylase UbiE